MVEQQKTWQTWKNYLIISGILAVMLELLLGITFLEQAFSDTQFSLHYSATVIGLVASLIVAPLPWFVIRMGHTSILNAMLEAGAGEAPVSKMEQTMASILIVCYVALNGCVGALARLS